LVGRRREKERKKQTICFVLETRDARWFVYSQVMDRNDNMGGGDSTCGNGNYERQTKSSLLHNLTHKTASWRP
jgi:hypothetical protein